jgi:hypothetical protein
MIAERRNAQRPRRFDVFISNYKTTATPFCCGSPADDRHLKGSSGKETSFCSSMSFAQSIVKKFALSRQEGRTRKESMAGDFSPTFYTGRIIRSGLAKSPYFWVGVTERSSLHPPAAAPNQ